MPQLDVYCNANPDTAGLIPYLLDIQNDLLDDLATRVVVPLYRQAGFSSPARYLNPLLEIDGDTYVMVTQELAGVPLRVLGDRVSNLSQQREQIVAALDFLITGF